ncbi:hypothetical protein LX36DRAFT_72309 [Colletotrichum falcatum]|nr:hypothetical protein LX36DRAFT_72309 [Colletotrichum falcatum]
MTAAELLGSAKCSSNWMPTGWKIGIYLSPLKPSILGEICTSWRSRQPLRWTCVGLQEAKDAKNEPMPRHLDDNSTDRVGDGGLVSPFLPFFPSFFRERHGGGLLADAAGASQRQLEGITQQGRMEASRSAAACRFSFPPMYVCIRTSRPWVQPVWRKKHLGSSNAGNIVYGFHDRQLGTYLGRQWAAVDVLELRVTATRPRACQNALASGIRRV